MNFNETRLTKKKEVLQYDDSYYHIRTWHDI